MRRHNNRGFTLIELLVVIAIIGILASVVLASLNSAREKARDAARKASLQQVNRALSIYYSEHGTYHIPGTGSSGGGQGWFSFQGSTYPLSIAQGLVNANLIGGLVHDPLVPPPLSSSGGHRTYMRYFANPGGATVGSCMFAELENPSAADIATMDSAPIAASTRTSLMNNYGMNYADCI